MWTEPSLLKLSLILFSIAAVSSVAAAIRTRNVDRWILGILFLALVLQTFAISIRWRAVGHGPYVNLYEILLSNTWSLHVAVLLSCLIVPRVRSSLPFVLILLQVLVVWLWLEPPTSSDVPVTYFTMWLAVHVWVGKIFLGCLTVATGLALTMLARRLGLNMPIVRSTENEVEELAFRFVSLAFLFETLMLISGAIWAQDAWGRYWDWDPLESWSFATWVLVGAYLHLRSAKKLSQAASPAIIVSLFAIAFFTFFGVPFVSVAAHKGAV